MATVDAFLDMLDRNRNTMQTELGDRAYLELVAELDSSYAEDTELTDLLLSRMLDATAEQYKANLRQFDAFMADPNRSFKL